MIKSHRLERKAIVYVRQPSGRQALHNQESRRLEYAMDERARRQDEANQKRSNGGNALRRKRGKATGPTERA